MFGWLRRAHPGRTESVGQRAPHDQGIGLAENHSFVRLIPSLTNMSAKAVRARRIRQSTLVRLA